MNACKTTLFSLGIVLATLAPRPALAARGELTRPHVALYASLPDALKEQIRLALQRKDCTFVSGSWVNHFTRLHYRSETLALQGFLYDLAKCPGVKVSLGFYDPKEAAWAPETSNWSVFHMPIDGNTFMVKVRLGSGIDLTKLSIPVRNHGTEPVEAGPGGADQSAADPKAQAESKEEARSESDERPQ